MELQSFDYIVSTSYCLYQCSVQKKKCLWKFPNFLKIHFDSTNKNKFVLVLQLITLFVNKLIQFIT